ncbi:hypothetical protein O0I10_006046 [Lichtheimia ornata]|uniref:Myb-like domain-containing protein n=1 Tax=Lichtheimia ornata TaxID=688661 RepID=A0AAD7V670_9FUNG|nr:uncharacterized protein O0I10_006046 [Lichtheimia ornata]KAJ8658361.1 hypothetical protein O0I10_006046 [Lichtheimia ornata]
MHFHIDNRSTDSNDDETVGWDSQGSIHEYYYISPMHDNDPPSTRFYYRHGQRMLYISDTAITPNINAAASSSSSINISMGLSPMNPLNFNSPIQKQSDDIAMPEDERETPNEPHDAGMERGHHQLEGEDDDQAGEQHHPRKPKVISAIPEDEASNGSPQDSSCNDSLDAWIEDNNGIFQPPSSPSHSHAQSSSHRPPPIASVPSFTRSSSSTFHASLEHLPVALSHPNPQHLLSAGDPNEPSQHSSNMIEHVDSSNEQQRLPHGLPNTSNMGPMSPIWISDDDDEPMPSSVDEITNPIEDREPLLQLSDTTSSSIQQQDDHQLNSQASTSVKTEAPTTQRRRRRRRRRNEAPTIVPSSRPRRNIKSIPASVLLDKRTYHRWTDEEVEALDEGCKRYGYDWVKIRAVYPMFANQTNAQLRQKAMGLAQKRG